MDGTGRTGPAGPDLRDDDVTPDHETNITLTLTIKAQEHLNRAFDELSKARSIARTAVATNSVAGDIERARCNWHRVMPVLMRWRSARFDGRRDDEMDALDALYAMVAEIWGVPKHERAMTKEDYRRAFVVAEDVGPATETTDCAKPPLHG